MVRLQRLDTALVQAGLDLNAGSRQVFGRNVPSRRRPAVRALPPSLPGIVTTGLSIGARPTFTILIAARPAVRGSRREGAR